MSRRAKQIFICILIILSALTLCGSIYESDAEVNDIAEGNVMIVNKGMDMTRFERVTYTVQFCDTLSAIAQKYCPADYNYYDYLEQLKKVNHCVDNIYEGDEIEVYVEKDN